MTWDTLGPLALSALTLLVSVVTAVGRPRRTLKLDLEILRGLQDLPERDLCRLEAKKVRRSIRRSLRQIYSPRFTWNKKRFARLLLFAAGIFCPFLLTPLIGVETVANNDWLRGFLFLPTIWGLWMIGGVFFEPDEGVDELSINFEDIDDDYYEETCKDEVLRERLVFGDNSIE